MVLHSSAYILTDSVRNLRYINIALRRSKSYRYTKGAHNDNIILFNCSINLELSLHAFYILYIRNRFPKREQMLYVNIWLRGTKTSDPLVGRTVPRILETECVDLEHKTLNLTVAGFVFLSSHCVYCLCHHVRTICACLYTQK
jgi:hypothetical protein